MWITSQCFFHFYFILKSWPLTISVCSHFIFGLKIKSLTYRIYFFNYLDSPSHHSDSASHNCHVVLPSLFYIFMITELSLSIHLIFRRSVDRFPEGIYCCLGATQNLLWSWIFPGFFWRDRSTVSLKAECTVCYGENGSLQRLWEHSCVCQVDSVFFVCVGSRHCIATGSEPYTIWWTT